MNSTTITPGFPITSTENRDITILIIIDQIRTTTNLKTKRINYQRDLITTLIKKLKML